MVTAEIQTPHQDRRPSLEHELALAEHAKYMDRYLAPSSVIPDVALSLGVEMNFEITGTLRGEGMVGDDNIAGLGRASRAVGEVINGRNPPYTLFGESSIRAEEIIVIDSEDNGEYIDINYLPPEKEKLESLANSRSISPASRLFSRLVLDASYPYEIQEGDGYVELESRDPSRAKIFSGSYSTADEASAKLCSNTEIHFVYDLPLGTIPITVDGQVVALEKHNGNHTAILTKPAVLNGVRLPIGTIVIPEGNEKDGYRFGFGRLSMFIAEDGLEAISEFPSIAHKESVNSRIISSSISQFQERCGEVGNDPYALVYDYMIANSTENSQLTREGAATKLGAEINSKLEDSESVHIIKLLGALNAKADEAAEAAVEDKATSRDKGYESDPKNRRDGARKVRQARLRLHKTFGADKVADIERLLFLKEHMKEMAA